MVFADPDAEGDSGSDQEYRLREKLNLEWRLTPLLNPRLVDDIDGQLDMTQRITLVYITEFFTDGMDFIYYIRGGVNMSKFLAGTFSGKPYDAPCFATPCAVFNAQEFFSSAGLDMIMFETVPKTQTKGLRWRYLYESAVKAWEKLEFDHQKLEAARKSYELYRASSEPAAPEDGPSEVDSSSSKDEVVIPASEPDTPASPPTTAQTSPGTKYSDCQSDEKEDLGEYERSEESDVLAENSEDDDGF